MATKRDREYANMVVRERFLARVAKIDTFEDAWALVESSEGSHSSNLGYALRFALIPSQEEDEKLAFEALFNRLVAKGYRWDRAGEYTIVLKPDGTKILASS